MADIYLTKLERKTIFTRSLIYVLVLFVIADITVVGPFFINFIPLLYIVSILISIKGVDKVLTGIIGGFTVFVTSLITNGFNNTTLLYTLNATVQLGLGMLSAHIIHQFILNHRLVRDLDNKKKGTYVLFLVLFTILSYVMTSAIHGDIFTYFESKSNLDKYISNVYNLDYDIKQVKHDRKLQGEYAYAVDIDGEEVHFVPVLGNAFKDANKEERLKLKNKVANENIKSELLKTVNDMRILKASSFELAYEYTKFGVAPDKLVLNINIVAEKEEKIVYAELAYAVKKLVKAETKIDEINIVLNKANLHIERKDVDLLTPEYIEGGFNIEDLDE